MALTGTFERNLDDKRRLAIPKRLREGFSNEEFNCLYIAPGTDGSLSLYDSKAFDRLAKRFAQSESNSIGNRNYLRLFYARAEKSDLDSQGRIRIPDRLADHAHITREVVLLGVHDHAEVWDRRRWQSFLEEHSPEFDQMAEHVFESAG